MRFRSLLPAALAGLAVLVTACPPPPFNYVKMARPMDLNSETAVDIEPGNPDRRAASRLVKIPGDGSLTVLAEPVNQTAQLDVLVFPQTGRLPVAQGSSPLEIQQVNPGDYYVVVKAKNSVPTRTRLSANFKPKDWDAASGGDGKMESATQIDETGSIRNSVDALAMDRTDWYLVKLGEAGALTVRLRPTTTRGKIAAEVLPPKGDPMPVDLRNGFEQKEAVKGDWYIKVAADETGAGQYALETQFEAGDPEGNSGEDSTPEGAGEIPTKQKPGTQNITGVAKDEVNFDKRDRTDFWKFDVPVKGKLSVALKPKDRASKIRAELVRDAEAEDGERVRSGFNTDVEKGPVWVKVFAPDKGDGSPYTLEIEFFPESFIDAVVVEIDKRSGCAVMVNKGTSHMVRTGVNANIMQGETVIASGVVEQAFPALSRVKVFGLPDCRINAGTTVKISGGGY